MDEDGFSWTREYDPNRRLLAEAAPTVQLAGPGNATQPIVTRFAYDANGNHTSVTDPRTAVTQLRYDALDRVTQVVAPATEPGQPLSGLPVFGRELLAFPTARRAAAPRSGGAPGPAVRPPPTRCRG